MTPLFMLLIITATNIIPGYGYPTARDCAEAALSYKMLNSTAAVLCYNQKTGAIVR